MTEPARNRHLSSELIQMFLDGESSPEDADLVRNHASSCARCSSEIEAWRTLFSELGGLADVSPSDGFQDRVLGGLELPPRNKRVAWISRIAARLGLGGRERRLPSGHMTPEWIQDLLEGRMPARDLRVAESHLHACRSCCREVEGWRRLMGGLDALPVFTPSAAFPERVMAHVRVRIALATAKPTRRERLQLLLRRVSPDTRKRLAAVAGAAVTPAATLGLLAYTVLSHPLVTPATLVRFVSDRLSAFFAGLSIGLEESLAASAASFRASSALEILSGSPTLTLLAIAVLLALTASASWVLYRNVITTPSVDGSYVR